MTNLKPLARTTLSPEILLWFLLRPRFYRQLCRITAFNIWGRWRPEENTGQAAQEWAQGRAVDIDTALLRITGLSDYIPIREKYRELFYSANRIAKKSSVRMGGAANLDLLFYLSEWRNAQRIIETGVSFGWSSLTFLISLAQRKNSLLVSTDMPYPYKGSEKYVGCVVPAYLRSRWQIIRQSDREALPQAIRILGNADICHYDSDKTYQGRSWAYPLLWAALRDGGCFISDDVEDNLAFHDFCQSLYLEPIIVVTPRRDPSLKKYTGVLIKP